MPFGLPARSCPANMDPVFPLLATGVPGATPESSQQKHLIDASAKLSNPKTGSAQWLGITLSDHLKSLRQRHWALVSGG